MTQLKLSKRIAALLLCLAIVVPIGVNADTLDDMKAQREELQNRQSAIQSELDELSADESRAQEYQATLEEKMDVLEEKIDTARANLKRLTTQIKELEAKIDTAEGQYDETMELLKERIKALYQMGDVGTIEILLNSTSLYDFSMKTETIKSVTERDKELMDKIRGYLTLTKADRDAVKLHKEEEARVKKQLEADQNELQEVQAENETRIADLQSQQGAKAGELQQLEEEDAALNEQIQALVEKKRQEEEEARKRAEEEAKKNQSSGSTGGSSGGSGGSSSGNINTGGSTGGDGQGMSDGFDPRWPVPGYDTSWVTCWYGEGGHNGFDIAANYGASIVASQAGQVLSSEFHYSWGNNVLLYHNGTYQTRYAHMSSMAVSAGQYVERGQVIGYVGSTGNSTGNHLHYEVYYNGSRVDPYPYLQ